MYRCCARPQEPRLTSTMHPPLVWLLCALKQLLYTFNFAPSVGKGLCSAARVVASALVQERETECCQLMKHSVLLPVAGDETCLSQDGRVLAR